MSQTATEMVRGETAIVTRVDENAIGNVMMTGIAETMTETVGTMTKVGECYGLSDAITRAGKKCISKTFPKIVTLRATGRSRFLEDVSHVIQEASSVQLPSM